VKVGEKHFESKNKNGRTDVDVTICFFCHQQCREVS